MTYKTISNHVRLLEDVIQTKYNEFPLVRDVCCVSKFSKTFRGKRAVMRLLENNPLSKTLKGFIGGDPPKGRGRVLSLQKKPGKSSQF